MTTKSYIEKNIEKLTAELDAVKRSAANETNADAVNELFNRAQALSQEIGEARSLLSEMTDPAAEREGAEARSEMSKMSFGKTQAPEAAESRGKDLKEGRSVTVASSNLIVPDHASDQIREGWNEVPHSLLDGVSVETFDGGDSYQVPYVKSYGTGDYTAEGADYASAEPVFGYAEINKTKITAYSEMSREALKLPNADYEQKVIAGNRIAIRKKLAREVMHGTGATGHLTGIFVSDTITADPVEVSAIDETTLDKIIYSYGGDEDVEGGATLILSKEDLKAFAEVRSEDGKKIYDIKNRGNYGSINEIPYVINSACPSLAKAATTAGTKCMAYGNLRNYCVAQFSPIEIEKSSDYKFKQGMVAYRGDVMLGGNVTVADGFVIVKKVQATNEAQTPG